MQDLDWDDLRFLLALRRHGSLAAASRVLKVNQTTAGRRLTSLEARLGTRLFERHHTGHRLTPAGLRACELADVMEAAAQSLDQELRGQDAGMQGRVRITAPGGFVQVLADTLAQLQQDHPALVIDLFVDNMSLDLVKREADLALRMVHAAQPSLLSKRLGQLSWALFASESYLRARGTPSSDFKAHVFVGYEAPLLHTPGGVWLAEHAVSARIAMHVNNVVSAIECAAAGVGIVAAPAFLARREPRLRRLPKPREVGTSPIVLVAQRDVARVPRVRALWDHIARTVREQPDLLS